MTDEFLKGNFKTKKAVVEKPQAPKTEQQKIAEELRERALTNLGGSMVYVERTDLTFDFDQEPDEDGDAGGKSKK